MLVFATTTCGIAMPAFDDAVAYPTAVKAIAPKAVVRPWHTHKHATTRTYGQGLTAWSPPL